MTSEIQNITIHDDGVIEMYVKCPTCKQTNRHTITHASKNIKGKTVIDFNKLESRCCDNLKCPDGEYKLYS